MVRAPHALDDDGALAAGLLLGLGQALAGFVIRVVRGVHFQLLLNHPETQQLLRGAEKADKKSERVRLDFSSSDQIMG